MNNKPFVKLTFDVEFWSEGIWLKPYITPDMLEYDPFPASMKKILHALQQYNAKATFFVTLEVTEKYPNILKDIADAGHEIGIHGPKHTPLCDYDPEEFKRDCIHQIALIEHITSAKTAGFRAAHFSLGKQTMWALDILKELGFTYDSSVFPMDMGIYGMPDTPVIPYEIIPGLTEIPTSIASFHIPFFKTIRVPFAGGIYFRFLPFFIFKLLVNHSAKIATPVIYFHPHELDYNTPQIKSGPWFYRWLKYLGTKKSFEKFEALLKNFQCEKIS